MPEPTEEQKRDLAALANGSDEDIDLSEMAEITDFTGFERGPFTGILQRRRNRLCDLNATQPHPGQANAKRIA